MPLRLAVWRMPAVPVVTTKSAVLPMVPALVMLPWVCAAGGVAATAAAKSVTSLAVWVWELGGKVLRVSIPLREVVVKAPPVVTVTTWPVVKEAMVMPARARVAVPLLVVALVTALGPCGPIMPKVTGAVIWMGVMVMGAEMVIGFYRLSR